MQASFQQYPEDEGWCDPLVDCPGLEAFESIQRELVDRSLVCRMRGDVYLYSTATNHWEPMYSKEAMVHVVGVIAARNVSVNYEKAVSPYINYLIKKAADADQYPTSLCLGTWRLKPEVGSSEGSSCLSLQPVTGLLERVPGVNERVTGWIVGTCLLDPVRRNTFAILYGPGGNGKSTVIRTLANTLRGASAPIPEQHITSKSSGLHSEIVEPLVSKRLLYCADVDLKNHSLNLGFVRSSTGQDKISTPMGEASVSCSVIIGSNSLPSYKEQDDWLTEAIMRRVIVLPMLVDALSIRGPELPDSEDAYITFALRCVHTRMNYEQPPLSSLAIMMTLLGSEWQHHMHLFCLDSCPRGGDTEVSMIEAMVILETLLGRSVGDVANKTRHGACQGTVFKLSTPLSPRFIMSQLTNQPSQSGNEPTYLSKDESGELVVEDGAWLSSAHIPSYTLVPEVFKDNTEYAKKISASNSAPMYGSRTLVVMYKGTEKCPYLPVERVRILGVTRKSSGPQAYGTNYMRIGIPEAVFEDICAKASRRLDLKNPAVEKVTKQGGFYLFTVTVPKLMKVHMLVLEDGQETVIEVPDPSGIFLMENAVGYSLAFEPAILTLIEPCDDQLDSDLGSGVPSMSMSSLAPSTIKPNKALADMLSSLSI
ncbi:hypothetical protein PCASD_05422 [Puccinia coronata f. sp. avenae]|uniref:SF3 helicase domain-containing protein n=1 Tax=Puccinia coronata f. sp. avenae TaxID=200324 RepID=A0A2N5UV48_9BASI|nr:hypothetical protein PCASD_05422 [Puccinia coronata f. sp. avenae]